MKRETISRMVIGGSWLDKLEHCFVAKLEGYWRKGSHLFTDRCVNLVDPNATISSFVYLIFQHLITISNIFLRNAQYYYVFTNWTQR